MKKLKILGWLLCLSMLTTMFTTACGADNNDNNSSNGNTNTEEPNDNNTGNGNDDSNTDDGNTDDGNTDNEEEVELIKLSTPIVSVSEEGVASWKPIEDAIGYIYRIGRYGDDLDVESDDCSVKLTEIGQRIYVMALGDGETYADSDWSAKAVYAPEKAPLETPVLKITDTGMVTWTPIENALYYWCKKNDGTSRLERKTEYQLVSGEALWVQAVSNTSLCQDSVWSEPIGFGSYKIQLNKVVVKQNGQIATWDAVPNADGYRYQIGAGTVQTTIEPIEITLQNGDTLWVQAYSTSENYSDGAKSDTVAYPIYVNTPIVLDGVAYGDYGEKLEKDANGWYLQEFAAAQVWSKRVYGKDFEKLGAVGNYNQYDYYGFKVKFDSAALFAGLTAWDGSAVATPVYKDASGNEVSWINIQPEVEYTITIPINRSSEIASAVYGIGLNGAGKLYVKEAFYIKPLPEDYSEMEYTEETIKLSGVGYGDTMTALTQDADGWYTQTFASAADLWGKRVYGWDSTLLTGLKDYDNYDYYGFKVKFDETALINGGANIILWDGTYTVVAYMYTDANGNEVLRKDLEANIEYTLKIAIRGSGIISYGISLNGSGSISIKDPYVIDKIPVL